MALSASKVAVGDVFEQVIVEDLKRTQIVQYAGASGDFNPLHTDEVFATQAAGNRTVSAHGMLTMGMTGKALTDYVGADRVTRYSARFRSQVWPGDDLTAHLTVEAVREENGEHFVDLTISTTNKDGAEVLQGRATARLDP